MSSIAKNFPSDKNSGGLHSALEPAYAIGTMSGRRPCSDDESEATMGFRMRRTMGILLGVLVAMLPGCSDDAEVDEHAWPISVSTDHEVVVSTSQVRLDLGGTERMEADKAEVTFDGEVGEREVETTVDVDVERDGAVGDLHATLDASEVLWPALGIEDVGRFQGSVTVELEDVLGVAARGEMERVRWDFVPFVEPQLEIDAPAQIFPNEEVGVEGQGVLRPEEGQTVGVIEQGQIDVDGEMRDLSGSRLSVEWDGDRESGRLRFDPAVIGVRPGELEAGIKFENEYADADSTRVESSWSAEQLYSTLGKTFIANISPEGASRGQLIELEGRGFVAEDSESGVGMLLRLEGTFIPADPESESRDLTGDTVLERVPRRVVDSERIEQDIWYRVVDRRLEGLGAEPGVFDGWITPVVYDDDGDVHGEPWQGEFEVLPTRQVVYLKYLPAFSVALDRYGLRNVESEIRDRILEVVHRDYEGVNIEFVEQPPEDFVSYATMEMGGPDPAGGARFGFDNTTGDTLKDTGNLHLDAYLGDIDRDSGERMNYEFGGIFIESFSLFSPSLEPNTPHDTEVFDEIFGPFMPELGGEPVLATEWPDGERADKIEEAIRVFGNVVGNTASHEMGHALGLTHLPEDWDEPTEVFHNPLPGGFIMDGGANRTFEQRGEIDHDPAVFNDTNREYLQQILPARD